MSITEDEMKESRPYYRCTNQNCKATWEGKLIRCHNCLGNIETIRKKDGKIEIVNK